MTLNILIMNKRLIIILSSIAALLLIPFIGMQFSDSINWTPFDFIIAAVLLLGAGLSLDYIIRKVKKTNYRIILSFILVLIILLIWAELAVGIFGSPFAGS